MKKRTLTERRILEKTLISFLNSLIDSAKMDDKKAEQKAILRASKVAKELGYEKQINELREIHTSVVMAEKASKLREKIWEDSQKVPVKYVTWRDIEGRPHQGKSMC